MKFLRPIAVGDDVRCYCSLVKHSSHSVAVKIETWAVGRAGKEAEKVTEGVFTYVAVDENGKLRPLEE